MLTAKELERTPKNSMVKVDKAHSEIMMLVGPGSGEASQAKNMVVQFHNQVNSAVKAVWGYTAPKPI